MTSFPLPLPATDSVRGEQPGVDLGGAVLRYRCADEVAPFAGPVIERFRQYHASGAPLDGQRTIVGFTVWQLRQSGPPHEYWITACDYDSDDIIDVTTDDLTFALWIEASQVDVVGRVGAHGEQVDVSSRVMFTKAALSVVDKGRPDELVLERREPKDEQDSGWSVRTAQRSVLRNKEVGILAGVMAGTTPYLLPHLALPIGSVVRFADGRCLGIWSGQGDLLIDGNGTPSNSSSRATTAARAGVASPDPSRTASDLEVLTETVDGVRLQARIDPAIAPLAGGILAAFAAGAAGPLQAGAQIPSSYATFTLQEGEGGTLLITTPDFSSPESYRTATTDDLTAALWAHAAQTKMARLAELEPQRTRAGETLAIQRAAMETLVLGTPVPCLMERIPSQDGEDRLADGTTRSGWFITSPVAQTEEERAILNIDVGELQACDPIFTPYYALPDHVMLEFAGGQLAAGHLLDPVRFDEVTSQRLSMTMGELLGSGKVSRPLFT